MTLEFKDISREWAIIINDAPVGTVYLYGINGEKLTSEWGFWIDKAEFRRKVFEKEIVYKLLDFFFGQMEFEALLCKTDALKYFGFTDKKADKYTKKDWEKYWLKYREGITDG